MNYRYVKTIYYGGTYNLYIITKKKTIVLHFQDGGYV